MRAASAPNGLVANGTSATAARAWLDEGPPADVQASASFFADSLIPGTLFVRGSNLDTATPTYYGLTVTRGLTVRLVKVVNGARDHPSRRSSRTSYFSATVGAGDAHRGRRPLQAVVFRADTGQWLTSDGDVVGRPAAGPGGAPTARSPDGGKVGFGRGRPVRRGRSRSTTWWS